MAVPEPRKYQLTTLQYVEIYSAHGERISESTIKRYRALNAPLDQPEKMELWLLANNSRQRPAGLEMDAGKVREKLGSAGVNNEQANPEDWRVRPGEGEMDQPDFKAWGKAVMIKGFIVMMVEKSKERIVERHASPEKAMRIIEEEGASLIDTLEGMGWLKSDEAMAEGFKACCARFDAERERSAPSSED